MEGIMSESKRRQQFRSRKPEHQLGDAPVDEEYHTKMIAVAEVIDEFFNGKDKAQDRKTGFVLMVFPFGDTTGRCNYMSNGADRKDIVVLMREMIARFSGQPEISGKA